MRAMTTIRDLPPDARRKARAIDLTAGGWTMPPDLLSDQAQKSEVGDNLSALHSMLVTAGEAVLDYEAKRHEIEHDPNLTPRDRAQAARAAREETVQALRAIAERPGLVALRAKAEELSKQSRPRPPSDPWEIALRLRAMDTVLASDPLEARLALEAGDRDTAEATVWLGELERRQTDLEPSDFERAAEVAASYANPEAHAASRWLTRGLDILEDRVRHALGELDSDAVPALPTDDTETEE